MIINSQSFKERIRLRQKSMNATNLSKSISSSDLNSSIARQSLEINSSPQKNSKNQEAVVIDEYLNRIKRANLWIQSKQVE